MERCAIELITPERALRMLELNVANRSVRPKWVKELSRRMLSGEWKFDGAPIVISPDGELLNGQHRLLALVMAGVSLSFVLVTGVSKEAFAVMDCGSMRRASDVLHIAGHKNTSVTAAVAAHVWRYETTGFSSARSVHPSHSLVMETIERHPSLAGIVSDCCNTKGIKRLGANSSVAFVTYGAARVLGDDKFDMWFSQLSGESATSRTDAVGAFVARLLDNRASKSKLYPHDVIAIGIKAVNYFSRGSSVRCLKWSPMANEEFPRFVGWSQR
jgi:hypothetical protein